MKCIKISNQESKDGAKDEDATESNSNKKKQKKVAEKKRKHEEEEGEEEEGEFEENGEEVFDESILQGFQISSPLFFFCFVLLQAELLLYFLKNFQVSKNLSLRENTIQIMANLLEGTSDELKDEDNEEIYEALLDTLSGKNFRILLTQVQDIPRPILSSSLWSIAKHLPQDELADLVESSIDKIEKVKG